MCLPKGLQLRTQKQSLQAVYHPFLITREDGLRSYGFAYTFYEEVNRTRICTALHSLQVFSNFYTSYWSPGGRLFTECESGAVTLESHAHNLLHEVHVPPPGRCLAFSCVGAPQLCYRPISHELPLLLYPLRELFSVLSPECVVQLLFCMLLENQVLLVSADYYCLMLVAECMCALVLPFTWHHVYNASHDDVVAQQDQWSDS
ncbi:DENN domain [Trinorchestia longiramus]|nr:DENN domain [Trinorchestia longiramus]